VAQLQTNKKNRICSGDCQTAKTTFFIPRMRGNDELSSNENLTMTPPASLVKLVGNWTGSNRLHVTWLTPPIHDSTATASFTVAAQGQFLSLAYTWADEGKPQDGLLIIGSGETPDRVKAVWVDSWHMGDKFMSLDGTTEDDGSISMRGAYAAPPGPDWGWRIVIAPGDATFNMTMYNITPEGEEAIAVEAAFDREK